MYTLYNTSVELDTRLARLLSLRSTTTFLWPQLPSIPHFFSEDYSAQSSNNSPTLQLAELEL
jgi:hypothetical protein